MSVTCCQSGAMCSGKMSFGREQCPEMVGNMKNEAPGLSQVTKQWVYTWFVLFLFQEISAMRN